MNFVILEQFDRNRAQRRHASNMCRLRCTRFLRMVVAIVVASLFINAMPAAAATKLKNICRIKGQEENTLQGLGLVVGLNGTGDGGGFLPTIRSLARAMELMGSPIDREIGLAELKNAKNVAVVLVTATVPAAGAREGDLVSCDVSSVGAAASLKNGRLLLTVLQGPDRTSNRVFAVAQGKVQLEREEAATVGRIHHGCRLEEDFDNQFTKDGRITLVLNTHKADFQTAHNIAEAINSFINKAESVGRIAHAVDSKNIVVTMPEKDVADPVGFIAQVLAINILDPTTDARVVINERTGNIVIGEDVEILPVAISQKNVVVETAAPDQPPRDGWIPFSPGEEPSVKLLALTEALKAVQVSDEDIINIIKSIDRAGALNGKLIIE